MAMKIVRPVGTGALFNTSRHALGICRRVCNTCRYTIPSPALAGQSLESVIEEAVATIVLQHGILRVGIAGEDTTEPYFSFVEAIDLREMVRWKSLADAKEAYDDALLGSLEGIHDSLWEDLPTRPGWEVIVHHPASVGDAETVTLDITFAFHHAYADGVASKLFHWDLLKALNELSSAPDELRDHTLYLTSPPALLPGMETLVPFKISWTYLLHTIWNEIIYQNLVPAFLKSQPSPSSIPWTGEHIAFEPHHVNIRPVQIRQATSSKLLQECRDYNTTLTPLLHALIALSLAKRLPAETAPAFSTTTPIDLRRYAKPECDVQNNIACLVTAHDDVFDAYSLAYLRAALRKGEKGRGSRDIDTWVWEASNTLSTQLRHKVSTLPNDDVVGMLSWVSDWRKFWTDKIGSKRGASWEMSNIGSLKAGEAGQGRQVKEGKGDVGGGWRILRSVMTQGALPAGSAFSVNVSGVEGEGVCVSLTWQEGAVEREVMDGLAADLRSIVKHFGESGSFDVSERG